MLKLSVRRKRNNKTSRARSRGRLHLIIFLVLVTFVAFLGVNIIIRGISLKNYLSKPLTPLISKTFKFSSKEKILIAIASNPSYLVSFDQKASNLKIVEIPQEIHVQVLPNYGFYPLTSAFGLGELENPPQGGQVLLRTLSQEFGGPIDYYVAFKNKDIRLTREQISEIKKEFSGINGLVWGVRSTNWIPENLETNFTLFDIYRLWWRALSIRDDKINYYKIEGDLFEDLALPEGKVVKTIADSKIGELSREIFEDSEILDEKIPVEVLNASEKGGFSSQIGQILARSGVDVSSVGNAINLSQSSSFLVSHQVKDSMTVKKIARFLGITPQEKEEKGLFDVTLILGEDLSSKF